MKGIYIYHIKPTDFSGDILYPLNILKTKYLDCYTRQIKKYIGREWLLSTRIPPLNCLWNDVLHFSLMHPALILRSLLTCGLNETRTLFWFEIPLTDVMRQPSILYLNTSASLSNHKTFIKSDFEPLTAPRVNVLSEMPQINLEYYRECASKSERPLLWKRAPHLLLKGMLDIRKYAVINWRS